MADGNAELQTILVQLGQELARPLGALREDLGRLIDAVPGDPDGPGSRGQLQAMAYLCDDLLELTRGYLDYTELIHGMGPLRPAPTRLVALAGELDRRFAAEAAARGLVWECRLAGADAVVPSDAGRCLQAVGHLIDNALKFTPEGGSVRVVIEHDLSGWSVSVLDTGPGIPVESLGRVLEPFFRLPRDDRPEAQGHGLGLAVCCAVVDQLGAQLALGPRDDSPGTRATIRFPGGPES